MKENIKEIIKIENATQRAITYMLYGMRKQLLTKYYDTNEMQEISNFIYENCIDGIRI